MKKGHFFGKALALCCLAFVLVLAGCDNPTRGNGNGNGNDTGNGNGNNVVNGNGNGNGNNGNNGNNVIVPAPSWSGPHAVPDVFDGMPYTIVFGNGMLMAVGSQDDGNGFALVKTSTNGRSWSNVTSI